MGCVGLAACNGRINLRPGMAGQILHQLHLVAFPGQDAAQQGGDAAIIVNQQNPDVPVYPATSGSTMPKVVPRLARV